MSVDLAKVRSIQIASECFDPCEHQCTVVFSDGQEKSIACTAEKISEFYSKASGKVTCSLGMDHFKKNSSSAQKCRPFNNCVLL